MSTKLTSSIGGVVAAALFGIFVTSGAAADPAGPDIAARSSTVKYADLNLSNPQGAAVLYSRIVWAAHEVCEASNEVFPEARVEARACVSRAIARAVTRVGRPQLTAIYNAKNREPLTQTVAQAN